MRQNKTSKKTEARSTYIYYGADGAKYELKPGVDGVTEMHIADLRAKDDEDFNAQRREDYRIPIHYQAYQDEDGGAVDDRNDYLEDDSINPETVLIGAITHAERGSRFIAVWDKLLPQQRELALMELVGRSNTDIAAKEGVTEAAIRNRLKKIQEKFKKLW